MAKLALVFLIVLLASSEVSEACKTRKKQRNMKKISRSDCHCGISSTFKFPRIVGGTKATPLNKYPWMVSLIKDDSIFCAAAIIAPSYILTAAHCFARGKISERIDRKNCNIDGRVQPCFYSRSDFLVELMKSSSMMMRLPIQNFFTHPKFNDRYENDVALVQLPKSLPCDAYIRPVCLPSTVSLKEGSPMIVSGWGRAYEGEEMDIPDPPFLLEATLNLMSYSKCVQWSEGRKNFICAKGNGQGICKGDSGGPIFTPISGVFYIFGVSSLHYSGNCEPRYPQYFTDVKHFMPWIVNTMKRKNGLLSI